MSDTEQKPRQVEVVIPAIDAQHEIDAKSFVELATDFTVDSDDVRALADEELSRIKRKRKAFDALREYIKAPSLEACRRVDGTFKPLIELCLTAEKTLEAKILGYDRELAVRRAEEQRIANQAAEVQRRALADKAAELQKSGDTATAASLQEAATLVSAPVVPIAVSTSARSTAKRETWSAEVVDLLALVKAVAAGTAPLQALAADMTYLNGRARLEKSGLKIDGVRAVATESLAAKRGVA